MLCESKKRLLAEPLKQTAASALMLSWAGYWDTTTKYIYWNARDINSWCSGGGEQTVSAIMQTPGYTKWIEQADSNNFN